MNKREDGKEKDVDRQDTFGKSELLVVIPVDAPPEFGDRTPEGVTNFHFPTYREAQVGGGLFDFDVDPVCLRESGKEGGPVPGGEGGHKDCFSEVKL
jgi:hypothetical protein